MVTVIGSQGNMGKRYCAILTALGVEYIGLDIRQSNYDQNVEDAVYRSSKIIVATPTPKHLETIQLIGSIKRSGAIKPAHVLCEKPIVTKSDSLRWVRKEQESGIRVFSVNQYAHHPEYSVFSRTSGRTYYNYFKSGGDGLEWDCFQLFVLAKGSVALNNSSPIWSCRINGHQINISGMDIAYVNMIQDFLGPMRKVWDLDTVEIGTRKVLKWIEEDRVEESL